MIALSSISRKPHAPEIRKALTDAKVELRGLLRNRLSTTGRREVCTALSAVKTVLAADEPSKKSLDRAIKMLTLIATSEEIYPQEVRDRRIYEHVDKFSKNLERAGGIRREKTMMPVVEGKITEIMPFWRDEPQNRNGLTRSSSEPSKIAENIMVGLYQRTWQTAQSAFDGHVKEGGPYWHANFAQKKALAQILRSYGQDIEFDENAAWSLDNDRRKNNHTPGYEKAEPKGSLPLAQGTKRTAQRREDEESPSKMTREDWAQIRELVERGVSDDRLVHMLVRNYGMDAQRAESTVHNLKTAVSHAQTKETRTAMLVERNTNGSYTVSELIEGHLTSRTYYGYSKADSISMFKQDVKKPESQAGDDTAEKTAQKGVEDLQKMWEFSEPPKEPGKEQATSKQAKDFKVAARSDTQNSFGLWGMVLVARDGEAWEVATNDINAKPNGTVISVPLDESGEANFAALGYEIPARLPPPPAKIISSIWGGRGAQKINRLSQDAEDFVTDQRTAAEDGAVKPETPETPEKYDQVGAIMSYESGDMAPEDVLKLFSHLIKTGLAWQLQGSYGRAAAQLIENGWLDDKGNILREVEGSLRKAWSPEQQSSMMAKGKQIVDQMRAAGHDDAAIERHLVQEGFSKQDASYLVMEHPVWGTPAPEPVAESVWAKKKRIRQVPSGSVPHPGESIAIPGGPPGSAPSAAGAAAGGSAAACEKRAGQAIHLSKASVR